MSAAVVAGGRPGRLMWSATRATFGAVVELVDGPTAGPVGPFVAGRRYAGLVTVDRLCDELAQCGLPLAVESQQAALDLRRAVTSTWGDAEVVGVTVAGAQRLVLLLPGGGLVPLQSPLDHPGHRLGWGTDGPATSATARLLVELALSRRWGPDEALFALVVIAEVLGPAGPSFSLNLNSLCDWFLVDAEPATTVTAAQRSAVANSLGGRVDTRPAV